MSYSILNKEHFPYKVVTNQEQCKLSCLFFWAIPPGFCMLYFKDIYVNVSTKFLYASGITGSTFNLVMEDITMRDDRDTQYSLSDGVKSSGVILLEYVYTALFNGTSEFNNILGPVIVATYSNTIYLTGDILFANICASVGSAGAAILLKSDTTLWLQEPLNATFHNNTAVKGGAVAYYQGVKAFCVFQYATDLVYTPSNISLIDINVSFSLNSAHLAGNSLYISNLYNCSLSLSPNITVIDPEQMYNNTFTFHSPVNNGLLEMSSIPDQVCFCIGEGNDTSRSNLNCAGNSRNITTIITYPGKNFNICVVAVDEVYRPVYTNMYSVLTPDFGNDWRLGYGEDIAKVYGYNCTQLNFSIYANPTKDSTGTISMYPYDVTYGLAIPILLKKCPLGFQLVGGGYCDCRNILRDRKFHCSIDTCTITSPIYVDLFWIGPIHSKNNSSLELFGYVAHCPIQYCSLAVQNISSDDFYSICRFNRTGFLCSTCQEGLSNVVGHPACKKCSNLYLLTIPFYAVAGIILVVLLFLLRLTVATGTINGLILFANLFNINVFYFFDHSFTSWLKIFISLLNLELGFPLCLYDGLTTVISSYLGYIVPVYLWSIVLIISFLSRHFNVIARLTSRSAIPVLATIIHLSFSRLLRAAIGGLMFVILEVDDGGSSYNSSYVWFLDGNVKYASGRHLGLLFLSLMSLFLFLLPYTVFLTGIKLFGRFKFVNQIRPFIDAFCAPYKDKWRFWFGARLLFLVVIYIAYAVLRNTPGAIILFETVALVLFTVVQAFIMPYKSNLINFLDLFFLTDAILVHVTVVYIDDMEGADIYVNVLMLPVFLMFLAIVIYHAYLALNIKERLARKQAKNHRSNELGSHETRVDEKTSLNPPSHGSITYSALEDKTEGVYKYNPAAELREPLLEK